MRIRLTFIKLALIASTGIALSLISLALYFDDYQYAALSSTMIVLGYFLTYFLEINRKSLAIWFLLVVLNVLMLYTAIAYKLYGFDLYFVFAGMVVAVTSSPKSWRFYLPFAISMISVSIYHIAMVDIGQVSFDSEIARALHYPLMFGGAISLILGSWRYQNVIFKGFQEKKRKEENMRELIKILSHDARSHLASLHAISTHLKEEGSTQVDSEFIQAISESSGKALDTLTELLEWLKSEHSDQNDMTLSAFPANKSVRAAIDDVQSSAQVKGIDIYCDIPAELEIISHSDYLSVILRNILTNSIKFAPEKKGRIEISDASTTRRKVIEIIDNGPGMSEDAIQDFDKGLRVRSTKGSRGEVGTGVGLSIIYNLCAHLHISPKISIHPDGGTRFELQFPSSHPFKSSI